MDLGDLALILLSALFGLSAAVAFVRHGATGWVFARLLVAAAVAFPLIAAHVVPDGSPLEAPVVVTGAVIRVAGLFAGVALVIVSMRYLGGRAPSSVDWRLLASLLAICVAVIGGLAGMVAIVVAVSLAFLGFDAVLHEPLSALTLARAIIVLVGLILVSVAGMAAYFGCVFLFISRLIVLFKGRSRQHHRPAPG